MASPLENNYVTKHEQRRQKLHHWDTVIRNNPCICCKCSFAIRYNCPDNCPYGNQTFKEYEEEQQREKAIETFHTKGRELSIIAYHKEERDIEKILDTVLECEEGHRSLMDQDS